jgi:branched-chain amino acid transport system permease protein
MLCVLPVLPLSDRTMFMLSIALVYACAAVGLDLFAGYGGQLMLGSFGFVGIGAYTSAALATGQGWNVWLTLPASILMACAVAYVLGAAMVRLPDLGVAMGSFFFGFVVVILLRGQTLAPITNGASGIRVTPGDFGSVVVSQGRGLYWLALACLALVVLLAYRYANCRAGRALRLVKRSPAVAMCMGIDPARHRLYAFCFAAMCAGLGGFVYSQALGFLSPENFSASESISVLTMTIVGGLGSISGAIIGSVAFTTFAELARGTHGVREVVFASLMLVCLIFFPSGLYGVIENLWSRVRRWRARDATAAAPVTQPAATPAAGIPRPVPTTDSVGLQINCVNVTFGGVRALHEVSIRVMEGCTHAIIGPNGAGKTTLLNCISGLQPYSGGIQTKTSSITGLTPMLIRHQGISRTFQHPSLVDDLSAIENVELGLYGDQPCMPFLDLLPLASVRNRDRQARQDAAAALHRVGFPSSRHHVAAADLTLAEQKTVDIARATVGAKRLLLLDEPTAGLEESEVLVIADMLRRLSADGKLTIVLIAHHVGFVRQTAHFCTVLDFGKMLAHGDPDEVTKRQDVIEVFLGTADA